MKKILLISFEYPIGKGYCGGVGQIVEQAHQALSASGYQPYVLISADFKKKYPVKLMLPDGKLINFANFNAFLKDYDWHKFSFVIHHFVNWTKELKKLKVTKGRRPRIIYHFHSILRREKDAGFRTLNHFLLNQEKMIDIADKIICPSRYEYDNFARYFPAYLEKVVLIENTFEYFPRNYEIIKDIRRRHNLKKNDIISLYVGRLERIKGADIILKNVPKILSKHRKMKFFMVGKALEKDLYRRLKRVQKKFPEQFFYIRYLEKNRLFQYYYLSQIYVNSSLSESFSLSTHEGAFCNNALLLNQLPVLDKFRDAAVFFDVNKNDFIHKFEYLINCKKTREILPKKAFRIARKYLDNNKLKENLSGLLSGMN